MDNNCATCQHWDITNPILRNLTTYAECYLIGDEYAMDGDTAETREAYTRAGEVANTDLITASSFGCVLWEARQ